MEPSTTAALIAGGAELLGGAMGISGSKDMAKNQRRFITKQMQNAHQWEVQDLRAAGLNPILSAGGPGARGGTMASPQIGNIVGPAVSSAMAAKRLSQELKNMKSQEYANRTQGALNDQNAAKSNAEAMLARALSLEAKTRTTGYQFQNAKTALSIPEAQASNAFWSGMMGGDMAKAMKQFGIEPGGALAGIFKAFTQYNAGKTK